MSISALSSAAYSPPTPAVSAPSAPAPQSAPVDKPHDGDGDDVGGGAPVSAAASSSSSTQSGLSSLKLGG